MDDSRFRRDQSSGLVEGARADCNNAGVARSEVMRSRSATTLLVLVLLGACSPAPSVIAVRLAPIAQNASLSAFEIDIPTDATLHIALADREDHLDVERSKKVVHQLQFAAKAGERLTVTVQAHKRSGDDVLKNFVEPLGGSAAVDAVIASAPAFAQGAVIDVETIIAGPGRSTRGVFTFAAPHHMTSQFSTTGVLPPGAPLRLFEWVMSTHSWIPATAQRGPDLFTGDGRPVSEQPAPIWTLWLQVQPTATAAH